MKIFIGGMQKHHQDRFERDYPHIDFTFAALEDSETKWCREASKAQYVIIDQSRCNHRIVQRMQSTLRIPMYFTDSKAKMREIINGLRDRGSYQQVYTAWAGTTANTLRGDAS